MNKELHPLWLKAAVAGGIWASFEIIVGSLLHNLHLPFSGTFLATFSVVLMISFLQLWKESGLIWRAGLICALMKSLSPSAVLLGPMTGILMEALLMDLVLFLTGRNLLGCILAGMAALLSTIIHKLASLFILYGKDLVHIYTQLFRFIQRQLHVPEASPGELIIWILIAYMILGALAALTGLFLGKTAIRRKLSLAPLPGPKEPLTPAMQDRGQNQIFRMPLLFLHIVMIPSLLVLINRYGLKIPSLIPAFLYLGFLFIYYKHILRRLSKAFFWIQLIIMTLLAAFFWHPHESGMQNFGPGFTVGLEMSLRAVIIVSAFSGLSVEFRNPKLSRFLLKIGFGQAHQALLLSFSSLPAMLDRAATFTSFLRKPLQVVSQMILDAEIWLERHQGHKPGVHSDS